MLKKIMIALSVVCLVLLSLFIYHTYFKQKVAYIDVPKVFNDFEMKKELADKYKKVEALRSRLLDSLSLDLQLMSSRLKGQAKPDQDLVKEFDLKRSDFLNKKRSIEEDNIVLSNQYDKQILERMSQYIVEFGKQNDYDLILGADGNGTVMYAKEMLDISKNVTVYINNKYKGIE